MLNFKEGDAVVREAFMIVLDTADSQTYEGVISLTDDKVISWTHVPGVQPSFLFEEYSELEETVKETS